MMPTIPNKNFSDVMLCLTRGAGLLLTPGMDDHEQVRLVLEEAARDPRHGEWESEIAGLVERGQWEEIRSIAENLRRQRPQMCLRCWHTWHPRGGAQVRCPRCRSPYWNRPRKSMKGI